MTRNWTLGALLACVFLTGALSPRPVLAAEPGSSGTVDEIIGVLQEKGLIDDEQAQRLRLKHAAEQHRGRSEALPAIAAAASGLEWSGDLRLRHESFWYDHGISGSDATNRHRMRYRARLGFKKQVNDWLTIGMRLASSVGNHRSTNITMGANDDFGGGTLVIDRAWSEIKLPTSETVAARLLLGKMPNPFRWKNGPDWTMWDGDINPEGAALVFETKRNGFNFWGNLGYLVPDESSSSADAKIYAGQLGTSFALSGSTELGLRASYYDWHSADRSGLDARSAAFGNLLLNPMGVDCCTYDDGQASVGEFATYLKLQSSKEWPVLVYGHFARNFEADDAPLFGAKEEDDAWALGLELGKKKRLKVGFGWFETQANALISTYTDSDVHDGFANREGFVIYGSRTIADHVDLNMQFFDGEEIKDGPVYLLGTGADDRSDRRRFRADLVIQF